MTNSFAYRSAHFLYVKHGRLGLVRFMNVLNVNRIISSVCQWWPGFKRTAPNLAPSVISVRGGFLANE